MNTALIIDIAELFQKQFGKKPYVVGALTNTAQEESPFRVAGITTKSEKEFTAKGSLIKEQYKGVEIMLPIRIYDGPALLTYLPYSVLNISGKKTIVETPLSERIGSVKEQFNIDDYTINVKGFLIADDRKFPEEQIEVMRGLYETKKAVTIDNALTNIFLTNPALKPDEQRRVVVYSFDMPEQQGGRENIRPFTMTMKSDTVFTLELEG
jgi:hypothetical protein